MNELLKKINVLIKASVRDLVGESGKPRPLTPSQLGGDVDDELNALRARIDDALRYQDQLAGKIETLEADSARLDAEADDALAQGRDDHARLLVTQAQRVEQRLSIARRDLREHQLVTQELIDRVSVLEAVVAETRRRAEPAAESAARIPSLSDVLRDAREKIAGMSDLVGQSEPKVEDSPQAIEEDLARRRQRLSK